MAFPTGYTKYQEITIDHTKVAGDLTDYIVLVDLANLVKAGADIFDLCRTDGGDLRATKTDGSTELAIEIVAIDTTAKTGEVHIKFTGTLSSSTDTVIRLWYNGTDTLPAASSTYGSDNVWTSNGYVGVWHMQTTSVDSTSLNNDGTDTSMTYGAKKIGGGADFNGTSSRIVTANNITLTGTSSFEVAVWVYIDTLNSTYRRAAGFHSSNAFVLGLTNGNKFRMFTLTGGAKDLASTTTPSTSTWYYLVGNYDGSNNRIYLNGVADGTLAQTGNFTTSNIPIRFGSDSTPIEFWPGDLDEMRAGTTVHSANWHLTTYNNQNSPSTFYSVGAEAGGSPSFTPNPLMHMIQTVGGIMSFVGVLLNNLAINFSLFNIEYSIVKYKHISISI